jgi:hypothetical protein
MVNRLFSSRNRNPYYIVAPPYYRTSAGVRALYLLCHALNNCGETAYIINPGANNEPFTFPPTPPDLMAMRLTQSIAQYHFQRGCVPITVYPEIYRGNILNAPCVVRYVLNYPGLLGGDEEFHENELCFGFSPELAAAAHQPENKLSTPVCNTEIFFPPNPDNQRRGTCFYAFKYQGELLDITSGSTRITQQWPESWETLAELFRSSELFYAYENTSLALEANLCGCPVVILSGRDPFKPITVEGLGENGVAWHNSETEIERARKTVKNVGELYQAVIANFWRELDVFIEKTQKHSKRSKYSLDQLNLLLPQILPISWLLHG